MSRTESFEDYILKRANKRYTAFSGTRYFTIFRVGDKFKYDSSESKFNIKGLKKLQFHNNREGDIPNADPSRKHLNQILIGSENLTEDVYAYLEGVKLRDNSVIAREIVLSAGNGFWERMTPQAQQLWIDTNIKFLKDNFGDNCVYAILHMDETTPHIHAVIVPMFYNEKKRYPTLNNSYYFDGKEKMSAWQDKYTDAMTDKFNIFIRGIKGSDATHVDLKTYYSLIKENLNTLSSASILAHAKENFLNRKKVEELQETLNNQTEIMKATEQILKNNKELKDNNKLYEYVIRKMADKYDIPEKEVYKIIETEYKNKDKGNKKDNKKQRER